MKRIASLTVLAAAMVLAIAARGNWNATIETTPQGWHRLGNPEAKAKLIEFVSYTCSHCSEFEREGGGALRLVYLTPGHVSIEVRHVIRDPIDLAAALTTNCVPRKRFFLAHSAVLRAHPIWMKKAEEAGEATQLRWRSGTFGQRMRAIADDLDFYELIAKHGVDTMQLNTCLANEAGGRKLIDRSNAAVDEYGITGTPSFVVNDTLLADAHSWEGLHEELDDVLLKRGKAP